MKNIKILHTADLHLDSAFEALPAGKAAIRRAEQRELLSRLAELARSERVDVVLLAGDIFDGGGTYFETGAEFVRCLRDMSVPVFIAPGNHDPYDARSPYAKLDFPQNVKIFTERDVECAELPELGVRVYGAAFTGSTDGPDITNLRTERAEGTWNILCAHGEVGFDPVNEQALSASGLDYAALGHIHKASGLRRSGGTWYSWPGCPEGRGFDECGEKGILQIDIDGETVKAGFIPTAARRYEKLRVEPGADALAAIRAALPKDTADDVYKIILTGESFAAPDLAYLRQALERDFFALTFSDETVPPRDLWRRAGEDSLAGRFLRRMQRRIEAAQTEAEKKMLLRAMRCGIAALEGWEVRL